MSAFMVIMDPGGFSEIPPVSKVIPLPTSAKCVFALVGRYTARTKRGGCIEPFPTA